MIKIVVKKAVAYALIVNLASMSLPQVAYAGLIGTQALVDQHAQVQTQTQFDRILAQEVVRDKLLAMGVSTDAIQARIAAMTEDELQLLEKHFADLPAGAGVIEVVGIVFVVLLILELVGVTDIFSAM